MVNNARCLYENSIRDFIIEDDKSILGALCDHFFGVVLTTQIEAWHGEISILKQTLSRYKDSDGRVIFEYDIPRLGKRIDAVLLLNGIVFCLLLL